jgi:predicted nuclease of predicted toxin-antitoxin system
MKMLFDQNLSPRLTTLLADLYPASLHVRDVGLESAEDVVVWQYALDNGLLIVSKDSDFHHRSLLFGFPPKVLWIRRGNCTTQEIEAILRHFHMEINQFWNDPLGAFLVLS